MLCFLAAIALAPVPADLLVTEAKIWTDGQLQTANAIAIKDGRFVFVGDRGMEWVGPDTKILNARGRVVIPGIIDSHTHLASGGVSLLQLQLREASSKADFINRVKEWAEKLPDTKWVIGRGWSAESWPEKEQPTKEWLDPVTGGRPAYLVRMDGHSALANSVTLTLSGINENTPNPPGGVIDKGPDGKPTGILRETAMSLVTVPPPTADERYEGLLKAIENANSNGITAVSDILSMQQLPLAKRYAGDKPTLRMALYLNLSNQSWADAISGVKGFESVSGWAEARGIKVYMDGSLGSRTAYMNQPYTKPLPDQKELRGVPMPGAVDGTYKTGFARAASEGLQVITHAIGDQANHDVLDFYGLVPGLDRRRFRVEHAQHLLPGDVKRFGDLGVVPSMQPYHKADDGRYCDEVIGPERSKYSYTFSSLMKWKAKLAFGSDWPVVTINPFEGVATAVTGRIMTGQVWMPEENITVDQALTCYTANGAYAMGWDKELGSIKPGYRADFVVLDSSPFAKDVDLAKIKPDLVFVDGRQVFKK